MSAVIIECPKRPPISLYDMLALVRPHSDFSPKEPSSNASPAAWMAYRLALAEEADLHARQKATMMLPEPEPTTLFICGDGIKPEPFCRCGHTAEMLCDHPMGRGKTCDLPICWCCSKHVGDDLDLCLIHFAEFVKRTGVTQINPWPPRRKA